VVRGGRQTGLALWAALAAPGAWAQEQAPDGGAARAPRSLEPVVVDDLAEFDAHLPTYIPIEELRDDPEAMRLAIAEWSSPEAEVTRQAFRDRVVAAIDGIATGAEGAASAERIAIVCHGGVINAYLTGVLGLPGTLFFEPIYTGVSRVIWRKGHRQFVSANEAPHLGAPRRPALSL